MRSPTGTIATGAAILLLLALGTAVELPAAGPAPSAPAAPGEPPPPPPPPIALAVHGFLPERGSEFGRERITLSGSGFAPGIAVFVGDAPATIVDVRPDRVRVKTPKGSGSAAVRVVAADGKEARAERAYEYVAPWLAARLGRVGMGAGDREDVVLVNGRAGEEPDRVVTVRRGEPLEVSMRAPRSRESARYVLYCWAKDPGPAFLSYALRGMGALVCPTPFTRVMPNADATTPREPDMMITWNNTGNERWLGPGDVPSRAAPCTVFRRAQGPKRGEAYAFQGLVEDDGSEMSFGWSITNAVVVRTESP